MSHARGSLYQRRTLVLVARGVSAEACLDWCLNRHGHRGIPSYWTGASTLTTNSAVLLPEPLSRLMVTK